MQIKNTKKIRGIIGEEIDLLRKGNSNPARANAIANLIGKLLNSVKLDIDVHRYVEKSKREDLTTPLDNQIEGKKSKKVEKEGEEDSKDD